MLLCETLKPLEEELLLGDINGIEDLAVEGHGGGLAVSEQTINEDAFTPGYYNSVAPFEDGIYGTPSGPGGASDLCLSSNLLTSYVEDENSVGWDSLEGLFVGNENESLPLVEESQPLLSWLWRTDDLASENFGELGFEERQNDMVNWLIS